MSVLSVAKEDMIDKLYGLEPGTTELLNQTKVVEILSREDREDRRLEFEMNKEEARRMEQSNAFSTLVFESRLKGLDIGVKLIDSILSNGTTLKKTKMNNDTKKYRDNVGYTFEKDGYIIGSTTMNNVQKENSKYD